MRVFAMVAAALAVVVLFCSALRSTREGDLVCTTIVVAFVELGPSCVSAPCPDGDVCGISTASSGTTTMPEQGIGGATSMPRDCAVPQ